MLDEFARPPIAGAPLSVLLTIDGAPGWEEALASWVTYLNGLDRDYELVLASERPDLSLEETARNYARGRAAPAPDLPGFGAALRRGLEIAEKPLLFYTRCDTRYRPAELQQLLRWIDKHDLVAGYRVWKPDAPRKNWRALAFRMLARLGFGVRLRDLGCLFLLARAAIFARIPIQSQGTFAHAEILAKANFLGCLMIDTPVTYQPHAGEENERERFASDAKRVFFTPEFGPADVRLDLKAGVLQGERPA